jgi:uncharacterized protein YprB with RNaseH-like and TPR domain
MLDDKGLVEAFSHVYNSADYVVAHYGMYYDIPMLQTRLLKHRCKPLDPRKPLVDTWWVARKTFKLHNNRLGTLAQFLNLEHQKTPLTPEDWIHAAHGNKKSLKYIVEHCKFDVLVLEDCFKAMRPFMKNEPIRGLFVDNAYGTCVSCGSPKLHSNGFRVGRTRRARRLQCQSCGKWQQEQASESRTTIVG